MRTPQEQFIDSVNKFNLDNKYNFSDKILWEDEADCLMYNAEEEKKYINFAVWDNSLVDLRDDVCVFQCSVVKSLRKKNQFSLPYSFERFNKKFKTIKDKEKPSVGFCGNYIAHPHRKEALFSLKLDKRLNTNFIWRLMFNGEFSKDDRELNREEYTENMQENAFIFCARGSGNFSIRFFETLSCGRIPALLDTDCLLPFDDVIDYSEFSVISDTPEDLANQILSKFNDGSYVEMQQKAYDIYQNYFHLDIVGKRIVEYLDRNYEKKL